MEHFEQTEVKQHTKPWCTHGKRDVMTIRLAYVLFAGLLACPVSLACTASWPADSCPSPQAD